MNTKAIIFSLIATSLLAPSLASASSMEFYVAQDSKTHKCLVMDKKPDGKSMMDVGTKAYTSKAKADIAMSKLKACK